MTFKLSLEKLEKKQICDQDETNCEDKEYKIFNFKQYIQQINILEENNKKIEMVI